MKATSTEFSAHIEAIEQPAQQSTASARSLRRSSRSSCGPSNRDHNKSIAVIIAINGSRSELPMALRKTAQMKMRVAAKTIH